MTRLCRAVLLLLVVLSAAPSFAQDPAADDAAWMWDQVVLYRDEWGVPHIFADNTRAMAFAFGYAQAEDHLEQMLMAYRIANGRAAEVEGVSMQEADRLAIRLDHAGLANDAYSKADPVTRDLCEGFALGVNTWITEHPDATPQWADGVHPADILALLHRYLVSQAPFDYPDALHLLPGTPSANAWAVSAEMSQTREPMLVINPHADYESPFQWYEAHVSTRETNVYGATLFGLPVLLQGHNGVLGWALAPNAPDIADVYVEQAQAAPPGDPNSVIPSVHNPPPVGIFYTEEDSRRFFTWSENGFIENVERHRTTPRGPVIAEAEGRPLTWRVGGFREFGSLRQLFDMGLTQDLDAFRRVLDRQQLSTFHVIYADAAGNIFYHYNAVTGLRPDAALLSADPSVSADDFYTAPVSTLGHRYEWGATLTPDTLPWLLNPETGYLQACGTPPWLATSPSVLHQDAWPRWLIRDEDSYRAKRVRRLFSIGPRSFEDMQAMLFDTVSPLAAEAVPYLLKLADESKEFVDSAHPDLRVMLDILREWNYLAEPGSTAMTAFHVWWSVLRLDESGQPWPNEIVHRLIQEDATWFREHALTAASEAAELLRNEYQSLDVPWGNVHVIVRGDKEYPLAGGHSGDPIFYTGDRKFDDGKWRVNEGYGFAMVVRFGETTEAVSLVPFGSSEHPDSPHFADQLNLMLGRRFKIARFVREDVERFSESATGRRLLLRPKHQAGTVFLTANEPMAAHLRETSTPPAALPAGLAAFTTYLEPIVEATPDGLSVEFDVHVDEAVCAAENLDSLYLYGYHPVDGWQSLDQQTLDSDRRSIGGVLGRCELVAALGPQEALLADPALVRPAGTPRAVLRLPDVDSTLPPAHNDDAKVTTLDESDEERVATLVPAVPRILEPRQKFEDFEQKLPDNVHRGKPNFVVPAVPPGFKPELMVPPADQSATERPLTPLDAQRFAPSVNAGTTSTEADAIPEASSTEDNKASDAAAEKDTGEPAPNTTTEDLAPAAPVAVAPVSAPVVSAPAAAAPAPKPSGGVVFSGKTPSEMQGGNRNNSATSGLELAPDPSRASPLLIGKTLEMRLPDGAAVFTMHSKMDTRAQAFPRDMLPAPVPAGLVAFSAAYEVLADPPPSAADIALVIRVAPNAVAAERFGELKLYTFDPVQGWKPFDKQRANVESHSFSAMDFSFSAMDAGTRTYAVFGPADAVAH